MRAHVKFLFFLVINTAVLFISYIMSFIINGMYLFDPNFEAQAYSNLFYLVAIKVFVFTIFTMYQHRQFSYVRNFLAIAAGNLLSIEYLVFSGESIANYSGYGLNLGLDMFLSTLIVFLFNALSSKASKESDLEDINDYMSMKNDLQALKDAICEKQEELKFLESEIEEKEEKIKEIKIDKDTSKSEEKQDENRDAQSEKKSFIPANTIELQSLSCPVRIEIGDKNKCIGAVYSKDGQKIDESQIIVDGEAVKTTLQEIKRQEEELEHKSSQLESRAEELEAKAGELDSRQKEIEKKEHIIDKTITNLEQISKTIKDRMRLLEEKENYINNQMKLLEEKEEKLSLDVHNQVYETIFNSPDLIKDEVKLKDDNKEIIIDKSDLDEIRQMIEQVEISE